MSARTGFARWWRATFESPLSAYNLDGDPRENRAMAKMGWQACKEAARQAVLDSASPIQTSPHLRAALDRIDRL